MRFAIFTIIIFYFTVPLWGQETEESTQNLIPYILSFSGEYSQAAGLSNAFSQSPDYLGGGNPAGPVAPQGLVAGIRWKFTSTFKDEIWETKYKYQTPQLPAAAGIVYHRSNFLFGLTYHQLINLRIDFPRDTLYELHTSSKGRFPMTIVKPMLFDLIHCLGANFAYTRHNFTTSEDQLTFGLQINYHYWRFKTEDTDPYNVNLFDGEFSWKVGLHYFNPRLLAMGLFYQPRIEFQDSEVITYYYHTVPQETEIHFIRRMPARWTWNAAVLSPAGIRITVALQYVLWQKTFDKLRNELEYAFGIHFPVVSRLSSSIGLYHFAETYKLDEELTSPSEMNFLTARLAYRWQNWQWQLEIFDSHLISDSSYKVTRTTMGMVFALK